MAQMKSLLELADRSFVIAFRFYGRYPETGRTFYHPPPCESAAEADSINPPLGRRHSSGSRPGLSVATSLILPSFSGPSFSVLFSSGTEQDLASGKVLLSPAPQNVGAH